MKGFMGIILFESFPMPFPPESRNNYVQTLVKCVTTYKICHLSIFIGIFLVVYFDSVWEYL